MGLINQQVIDRMVEHIRNETTDQAASELRVPASNFVSDRYAEAERALFRRLPLIAAHTSELPQPGSFITREIMGTALIIVRQKGGAVAAFLNMCRHRGGMVESERAGTKSVFVCKYHGWSYERDDGALRGVPYENSYGADIDRDCNGLVRVAAEERHGFVWVNLSGDAAPVAEFLGAQADAQLASFDIEKASVFLDRSFTLDINWKLVVDGAIDILHPQFLHPTGVGKLFQTNVGVWEDYGRHGQLFTARRRLAEKVRSDGNIDGAWKYFASNFMLYPNAMVIAAPDHIEFWTVWPAHDTASRSTTQIRFLVRPEILTDEMTARLNQSWEILSAAALNEDWPMEAAIQANARTRPEATFLYGRNEIPCQHLHRQLQQDLATMHESIATIK